LFSDSERQTPSYAPIQNHRQNLCGFKYLGNPISPIFMRMLEKESESFVAMTGMIIRLFVKKY
jgi:hypothetical protein